jgi:phospholipid/cholesterol/gamma-HCH transport system permease protein
MDRQLRIKISWFLNFLKILHDVFELFGQSIFYLFVRPYYIRDIIIQMHSIGVRSLPIVILISAFTGMVLALQSGYEMAVYGAKMYVGSLISISLVRELGPVLIAMVVAGRVGSGIAAELGSMSVTEQIDAMRALGTNPIKKLASTRLIALTIMLPVLTVIGDIVGIFGGSIIAVTNLNIPGEFYWNTVVTSVTFEDITAGLVKPFVFAVIIAVIGCYMGFMARGGTQGVGEATTRSVVVSSILIFIFDFFLTKFLIAIA